MIYIRTKVRFALLRSTLAAVHDEAFETN